MNSSSSYLRSSHSCPGKSNRNSWGHEGRGGDGGDARSGAGLSHAVHPSQPGGVNSLAHNMPAVAGRDSRHLLVDLGPDPAGPCVCVCVCVCVRGSRLDKGVGVGR